MSIIHRELQSQVVFNHSLERLISIRVKWEVNNFIVVNVYVHNASKERDKGERQVWAHLNTYLFQWACMMLGDFIMLEARKDKIGASLR